MVITYATSQKIQKWYTNLELQKFEGDTSLTRDDYYIGNGDDYSFNGTLFGFMQDVCQGNFDFDCLALYRSQRYTQSKDENPEFYYGPKSLLLYGAASFLYELFPSLGPDGTPDLATISSFFGAVQNGDSWSHVPERIPPNWYNRKEPYSLLDVTLQIDLLYLAYPVLFGGNTGNGGFDLLNFGAISNGTLTSPDSATTLCLIYQLATDNTPTSLSNVLDLPLEIVDYIAGKLNPIFKDYGCTLEIVQ
jgi:hypothetical protein